MLGFFRSKLPVDRDEYEWLVACFAWLAREFEGLDRLQKTVLVLPDDAHFPVSTAKGHARALELFEQVKAHAEMTEWPCSLIAGATEREARVSAGLALRHTSTPPLGTFGYAGGRYIITYNPSLLIQPENLVATFAHELAHYLIHNAATRPPGGPELEEHATDMGAVFLGFGVFMANASKSFRQFQNFEEVGWESRRSGYLSELSLVTALAMFIRLTSADAVAAERALKNYLRAPLRKALAAIDREHPDLAATLERVDLAEWR